MTEEEMVRVREALRGGAEILAVVLACSEAVYEWAYTEGNGVGAMARAAGMSPEAFVERMTEEEREELAGEIAQVNALCWAEVEGAIMESFPSGIEQMREAVLVLQSLAAGGIVDVREMAKDGEEVDG